MHVDVKSDDSSLTTPVVTDQTILHKELPNRKLTKVAFALVPNRKPLGFFLLTLHRKQCLRASRLGLYVLRVVWALLFGLILLLSTGIAARAQPRIIKVLAMAKASSTPTLTMWLVTEPSIDPTVIATREWGSVSGGDIRRYMRIYFPRNYDELVKFEFIFLAQVDMSFVTPQQAKLMYDALMNNPMGAVNTRSIMSAVSIYYLPWRDSILSQAFPNDVDAVIAEESRNPNTAGPLVIRDDPSLPNILKPYKRMIEPLYPDYGGVYTVPRPGSVILSYTKGDPGLGTPVPGQIAHIFYWKWNASTVFTFRDMVTDAFWHGPAGNTYSLDIVANVIWWATGRDLPHDPLMVHDYRVLVSNYAIQKSLLTSLLDFAEVFGADTSGIYAEAEGPEEYRSRAAEEYLDRDFSAAHDTMKMAMAGLDDLEDDAARLKGQALLWVHMVQWLVTTGTLLTAAVVLWALMIRRSLYRETSTTEWTG